MKKTLNKILSLAGRKGGKVKNSRKGFGSNRELASQMGKRHGRGMDNIVRKELDN